MYMKLVLLIESVLFSLLVLLGNDATTQLAGGFVVSVVFFFVASASRPYEDDVENSSDILARITVCLTMMLGLIVAGSGTSTGVGVVLIIISCANTLWYFYTIDLKDILLSRFFLLLQLYAQAKASRYTKSAIKKMPSDRVRRIADSPIEFHVLSAVQRIHFATLRKKDFFGGKRIKELADLDVTWLDLQQMDFTCASLRELGFTTDELMAVDAQLDDMGDRSDIQKLYEDAYNERKSSLGEFDRSTLAALHTLGVLYKDMGEHRMGMETITLCYKARAKHLGEEDEDTLVSQQFIGEYYVFLSRAADGVELLQKCYEIRKTADPESEATLDCMRALGKALQGVKLSGEALTLLEARYVAVVKQTMANKMRRDHPCTLPCRLDYANALADCGCFTSVPDLKLASIMNRQKTIYGADHPTTLKLMDDYAALLTKMGALNPACLQLQECVSEKAATLGPNHTGTIGSKFALAACLLELGRVMEMERLGLEACLADQDSRLGETHPSTITSMVKLAALYTTMNKHKEALALFKTCHEVRVKSLGKDHELTLGIASNIAATYDALKMFTEAREIYEETLTTLEERFGKTHLSTTAVLINLGLLYQRTGNLAKARKFYQDTLDLCTEAYGDKHPRTMIALDYIGCVDLIENKFAEAKEIFERCMVLKKSIYEETHPLCLIGLENIATAMQRLGQKAESVEIYRKLCALRDAGYGHKHIDSIKARAAMAIPLAELGNSQEAVSIMVACINDTTALLGPAAAQVQEYLGVLAYMYAIYGQYDEALRLTNQAIAGTIKIYGENHFLVKGLLERKVWMLTNAGRTGEAAQVTAIINAMPGDGSKPAAAAPAAAPAASVATATARTSSPARATTNTASAATTGATGAVEETLSPLQQQLQAEQGVDKQFETQVAARLQQILQMVQAGQLPSAAPLIQSFLVSDLPRVRETQTIVLAVNVAAMVLNAQQPQVALQMMMCLYPIISANFGTVKEVLLPSMDMLGKAHAYSGNIPAAIPILEEYIRQARKELKPGTPNPTLQQTEALIVQLYGSQRQFDKAIALYTEQFQFYRDTEGETSEAAITALNDRAKYWFALKDFDKARADHPEVMRLLITLQGAEHPETVMSLEGFRTLYAQHGQQYEG
jgi:tetratricopeptide (TPR) repeat protein